MFGVLQVLSSERRPSVLNASSDPSPLNCGHLCDAVDRGPDWIGDDVRAETVRELRAANSALAEALREAEACALAVLRDVFKESVIDRARESSDAGLRNLAHIASMARATLSPATEGEVAK